VTNSNAFRLLWSSRIASNCCGLAMAREKGWLLAWDANGWLYLLDQNGRLQGQVQPGGDLTTACCADDGSACAAVGARGEIWWLAPDLTISWERNAAQRVVARAMDPFGQYLAVADAGCHLQLLDRRARRVWEIQCPRPFHHLAFVPAAPYLIAGSDYGLVACLDFQGKWVWRDGLVAHIGALTVSGDGEEVQLACFTEGLHRYTRNGTKKERRAVPEPCRMASLSFDGQRVLVTGLSRRVHLLHVQGDTIGTHICEKSPVGVALGALGELAVVALPDGTIMCLEPSSRAESLGRG
jgi:hypothetical protein